MAERLTEVVEDLKTEEREVADWLNEAESAVQSKRKKLRKIRKALTALGAKTGEGKKPGLTTKEVIQILTALLAAGPLQLSVARERVIEAIKSQNKSAVGISLRFNQAISEFDETDGVLTMKSANNLGKD